MVHRILAAALFLGACASGVAPQPQAAPDALPIRLTAADPVAEAESYSAALAAISDISRSRYVEGECAPATTPDRAYTGFPVQRCRYEQGGLVAVVYVLDAEAADIARWIANACLSIGRGEEAACAGALVRRMRASNGFIFPVAGDVLEKARDAGPGCAARYGDAIVHVYFRDGVTIETDRGFTCETYAVTEADAEAEAFKAPAQTFNVGRIAALSRADYARLAGVPRPDDAAWRAIVRDSYLNALRTGRYTLLDLVARDLP
ncbi:MAG: hypothetical protein U5J99_13450 [Parvularculaceae bacterium]|nr:hypothetical protein [Parvularculaceae bacterium]